MDLTDTLTNTSEDEGTHLTSKNSCRVLFLPKYLGMAHPKALTSPSPTG